MERITRPDLNLTYQSHQKNASGGKGYAKTGSAAIKDYPNIGKFDAKSYSTGAYAGNKGFWMGDFKFSTKEVDTKNKQSLTNSIKDHKTKNAEVKTARESSKQAETKTYATRSTEMKGRSQDKIDQQGPQALNTIQDGEFKVLQTIDDVRDLLNKSR